MVSIKEEIKNNDMTVFLLGIDSYRATSIKIIKELSGINDSVVYCTVNTPYEKLVTDLKKNKISDKNFFFIDCISGNMMDKQKNKNCVFVSSPGALTDISMEIGKAINGNPKASLIFDSVSALSVHSSPTVILKFLHFTVSQMRIKKRKSVYIIVDDADADNIVLKNLALITDNVVKIK